MAKLQWTAEGPVKITRNTVEAVWKRRKPGHRLVIRDAECRGLALVVNPTGMAWAYSYKPRGTDPLTGRRFPTRSVTIGNPATHPPEAARAEANRIKGQAQAGADPAAEKREAAAADSRKRATTLSRLLGDYAVALRGRPKHRGAGVVSARYAVEEVAQARMALAQIKAEDMPAADLGVADLRRLLAANAGKAAPARARFGALSRFLDWCHDAGHILTNPCLQLPRTRRPKAPQARAHFLTPEELARLWNAADQLDEPVWRDLARFLIAVPCRRSEAAQMEWGHVDLAAGEWRQPGKMTKNREPHRLHLHSLALTILRGRFEAAGRPKGGLVFAAPKSGKPVDTFSDMKTELTKTSGVAGWTWHDFRRSFATALGEAGIPEAVADAVLNHRQAATRGGVLGVYQRASRWPEQMRAMQIWGEALADALGITGPDKVMPLHRAPSAAGRAGPALYETTPR